MSAQPHEHFFFGGCTVASGGVQPQRQVMLSDDLLEDRPFETQRVERLLLCHSHHAGRDRAHALHNAAGSLVPRTQPRAALLLQARAN